MFVQNRGNTTNEIVMPDRLFPIDRAEAYFRKACANVERRGNVIRWPHYDGTTELRVDTIEYHTHDKWLVSEMVTVEHFSDALAPVDATWAAHLNKWATLSAFLATDGVQPARLVCKTGIFNTDRKAAEHVYAHLMCTEAMIVGWHAKMIARDQYRIDPEQSPLSRTDIPPPYDSSDFEAAKAFTDRMGLVGHASESFYSCEFPWDPGAASHLFRLNREQLLVSGNYTPEELDRLSGRTILLWVTSTEPHPLYGNGLLCRLELPLPASNTADLVEQLNHWELRRPDFAPLYGAWCIGNRAPTFVTFVPNQFCLPGLPQNLTHWSYQRALRV
ncbi:MAG TPA: hypothetical protein VMX97_14960, partial [Hyphomicrobiaceae bacterium]|nr:hypothetical protein [Hyphomicrobiaceae bacterium]